MPCSSSSPLPSSPASRRKRITNRKRLVRPVIGWRKPAHGMGDDLPIIAYSTGKYVDAKTLSRIRSHAQQRVQDDRLARRTRNEGEDALGESAARTSRDVVRRGGSGGQQAFTFVFEQQPGQHTIPATAMAAPGVKRRSKAAKENEKPILVKRESHSLSASPGERPDPFAAFPVTIDAAILDLAESYLHTWRWNHAIRVMFQETLAHPVLVHSFLTVAYKVCKNDEYRCLFHENMTLGLVRKGIQLLDTLDANDREASACALTWSIIRLATVKINEGQLETSINHLNALTLISPDMTVWDGHMFGQHFQTTTASLLLANFAQSSRIKHTLHLPFGPMTTAAVTDVGDLGYSVPPSAILLDPTLSAFVQPEVVDALLALTALYNISTPIESLPHAQGGPQAREAVKISLRLSHCSDQNVPTNSWRTQFAECVRLTALLFAWSFGRNVDSQRNDSITSFRRHNRAFLTSMLIGLLLEQSGGSPAVYDFLLWILIVCGSTTPSADDREYYAGLIRLYFPDFARWGVEHVKGLGRDLPWIELEGVAERPQEAFWRYVLDPRVSMGVGKSEPLLLGYVGITPGLRTRLEGRAKIEEEARLYEEGKLSGT